MSSNISQELQVDVRGGFIKSTEGESVLIRALGFEVSVRLLSIGQAYLKPIFIEVENILGNQAHILEDGQAINVIERNTRSLRFQITPEVRKEVQILTYPADEEEIRFIIFGDNHAVLPNLQQIVQTANQNQVHFVVPNGDLVHSGRLEEYHEILRELNQLEMPFFTSIGNHDKRVRNGRKNYKSFFGPFYYAFGYQDIHFIVLDSSRKRGIDRFQYKWLERELEASQGRRIIIFLHRPAFCPGYGYACFSDPFNTKKFIYLMEKYQVEAVFGSHIHIYENFLRNGVRYFVTGGGGGVLWQTSNFHHYLQVFVKKTGIHVEVIDLPTPEAKLRERLKEGIKFNVEFHLKKKRQRKIQRQRRYREWFGFTLAVVGALGLKRLKKVNRNT
jgi:predicted phosphodiesterase